MRLLGKSVIITGAFRGIGRATAILFAQQGADVLVNALEEEEVRDVCNAVKASAKGKVCGFKGDVSHKNQVDAMFELALKEFGKVDILINNAAVAWGKHFLEYTEEWWDDIIRNNLKSVYLTSHCAAGIMARQNSGCIINLSSIGSTKAHRQMVAYDASKGAIDAMTRALAVELGPWNIRVNAISPAVILGAHVKKLPEETILNRNPVDFQTPLLKQGEPEDVAYLAMFLASDEAGFITGQVVGIDGGLSVQSRTFRDAPAYLTPQNLEEKGSS